MSVLKCSFDYAKELQIKFRTIFGAGSTFGWSHMTIRKIFREKGEGWSFISQRAPSLAAHQARSAFYFFFQSVVNFPFPYSFSHFFLHMMAIVDSIRWFCARCIQKHHFHVLLHRPLHPYQRYKWVFTDTAYAILKLAFCVCEWHWHYCFCFKHMANGAFTFGFRNIHKIQFKNTSRSLVSSY